MHTVTTFPANEQGFQPPTYEYPGQAPTYTVPGQPYPVGIQQPVPYEYPGTATPPNYQYPVSSTGLPDDKY